MVPNRPLSRLESAMLNKPISVFHDRRMSPNEQVQAANNTRRAGGSQAAQSRAVRRRVVE